MTTYSWLVSYWLYKRGCPNMNFRTPPFILCTKDGALTRFVLFLICYGLCVMSLSNIILYLNYRTLGYSWHAVLSYIVNGVELYLALAALIGMFSLVYVQGPSRSPFS